MPPRQRREDSAWREILEYFDSAIQLGMTATPKETKTSNIDYFGEPVYTYSLRQGIEDGYLAPYKVIRVDLTSTRSAGVRHPAKSTTRATSSPTGLHADGLRPIPGARPSATSGSPSGSPSTSRHGPVRQDHRLLRGHRPRQPHASRPCQRQRGRSRQRLAYVMQITGDDQEGKQELDNFIDPE